MGSSHPPDCRQGKEQPDYAFRFKLELPELSDYTLEKQEKARQHLLRKKEIKDVLSNLQGSPLSFDELMHLDPEIVFDYAIERTIRNKDLMGQFATYKERMKYQECLATFALFDINKAITLAMVSLEKIKQDHLDSVRRSFYIEMSKSLTHMFSHKPANELATKEDIDYLRWHSFESALVTEFGATFWPSFWRFLEKIEKKA